MADKQADRIDEERARTVWHRAAQLQAEAAQRLEERSRRLADRSDARAASEGGLLPSEVEAAAVEAGISPEFVQLALAEQGGSLDPGKELKGWKNRLATRLLRTPERSLEVSRVIRAAPAAVVGAMQRLLPNQPYFLTLRDTVGDDPLRGAVLVFDVPSVWSASNTSPFAYAMAYGDFKQLRFMTRPLEDDSSRCEVVISVDLRYSIWLNFVVGNSAAGVLGTGGGIAGAAIGVNSGLFAGALLSILGPVLFGGIGLVLAAGLTTTAYGPLYRWGIGKASKELDKLLQQIEVNARLGGSFAPSSAAPPAALPGATAVEPETE